MKYCSIPNTRNQLPVTFERLYLSRFYFTTRKVDHCLLAGTMPYFEPLFYWKCSLLSCLFVCTAYSPLCLPSTPKYHQSFNQISLILNVLYSPLSKNQVALTRKNWTAVSSRLPMPAFSCSEHYCMNSYWTFIIIINKFFSFYY